MATSSNIENKTPNKQSNATTGTTINSTLDVNNVTSENVLNQYRSYTYKFTLAGLDKGKANDPLSYRNGELDLVILKSGGKGSDYAMKTTQSSTSTPYSSTTVSNSNGTQARAAQGIQAALDNFNQNSPGRFDMYIDNVELITTMAFSEASNTTFVTGISFDVFEPYSISGFIEALHTAAVAAGYLTYMGASFLLKIEFIGYNDKDNIPKPEFVEKSSRYIPFVFKKVEVDVSESGTRYRCQGVPVNQFALGEYNQLKAPVKMVGRTVKEVLENLMTVRSKQQENEDTIYKKDNNPTINSDTFEIKFPTVDEETGEIDYSKDNPIAGYEITKLFRKRQVYSFPDPGTTDKPTGYKLDPRNNAYTDPRSTLYNQQPTVEQMTADPVNYKYEPNNSAITFANGANIHAIISSVIRDSEYFREIVSNLGDHIDQENMVSFWKINTKIKIGEMDATLGRPSQTITYVVTPYKVHLTQIPGYMGMTVDPAKTQPLALRTYNYIYSGKNTDVLNFKLNFDTMFYEALPKSLGNNEGVSARDSAGRTEENDPKLDMRSIQNSLNAELGIPLIKFTDTASNLNATDGNAGPPAIDPWSILAKNAFRSLITNAQYNMLKGDLEIIGDPFYLVTGGIGNYDPKMSRKGETVDGEADTNYGQVLINLNFKNPIDINPLDEGGRLNFESKKLSFSGIYMVNRVRSVFKDGVFKQHLEVARLVGTNNDIKGPEDSTESVFTKRINPLTVTTPDASKAVPLNRRQTSLMNAIQGINNAVASIASVEANVVSAVTGAVAGVANAVGSVLAVPGQALAQATQSITNAQNGIGSAISLVSGKLGLTPQQLLTLSPKDIASLATYSRLVPSNVDITAEEDQGVIMPSDINKVKDLPPVSPKTVAPNPPTVQ